MGEAGPSAYHTTNGSANKNGGAGKRKRADAQGVGKGQSEKQRRNGGQVHWDDPSYIPAGVEEDAGGYRAETATDGVDAVGEDGLGEIGHGDYDDWEEDHGEAVSSTNGADQPYTNWKYDEWGEPYDSTYQENEFEAHPDDYYEDEEDPARTDSDSSEDDTLLPFAIPDVAAYHASLAPTSSTATLSTTPHRPPSAVGGGGRTLTHTEIWSSTSIVGAFNAALAQYCSMHSLPVGAKGASSALWDDAPGFDSLLAQQVREDTAQILAQRRTHPANTASDVVALEASVKGVIGEENGTGGGGEGTSMKKKQKGPPPNPPKHVVTHVPHGEMDGNRAWKRAVKTVQTTPNQVGTIAYATQHDAIADGVRDHAGLRENEGSDRKIDQEGKAVQEGKERPGEDGTDAEKTQREAKRKQREAELHAYWYAGYRAGVAAAHAKANEAQEAVGEEADEAMAATADTSPVVIADTSFVAVEANDPAVQTIDASSS
uniref:Uncharacterized protein n=2 Tax=Kalmanozyma brasiliensis (strain GHG001) TaxID=1365824 RepID=V5GQU4_KALBG